MPTIQLLRGDCLIHLRALPAGSVDAGVTDPPYGLAVHTEKDIRDALACWLRGEPYVPKKRGFMGKAWDAFVPEPDVWREVYRVLKPGAPLFVFAGTRTADLMGISLRLAGFEIRDTIKGSTWTVDTGAWIYGSGFPKSLDLGKALDKAAGAKRAVLGVAGRSGGGRHSMNDAPGNGRAQDYLAGEYMETAPATPLAQRFIGYGTALKPAWEPIIFARKPLAGTVAENVRRWGTGGLNIDGCRVAPTEALRAPQSNPHARGAGAGEFCVSTRDTDRMHAAQRESIERTNTLGRWPPNVLLSHHPDCRRVGEREVRSDGHFPASRPASTTEAGPAGHAGQDGLEERHTAGELVAAYDCAPDCSVAELDRQTGTLKSGKVKPGTVVKGQESQSMGAWGEHPFTSNVIGDSGGASRFFPQFEVTDEDVEAAVAPFLYCAKAARSEREAGCEDLPVRTALDAVGRNPESAGAKNPRAGAGRGAGAQIERCSACGEAAGASADRGMRATPCAVNVDGVCTPISVGTTDGVHNFHPTVKPLALVRWLVKLALPPGGGVVLDPFAGSGTTPIACVHEGASCIAIELDEDETGKPAGYVEIIQARVAYAQALVGADVEPSPVQVTDTPAPIAEPPTAPPETPPKVPPQKSSFLSRFKESS